jgi:hypothetical protein
MQGPPGFKVMDMEKWAGELRAALPGVKKHANQSVMRDNAAADGGAADPSGVKPEAGSPQATSVKPVQHKLQDGFPGIFKMYQLQVNDGKAYHVAQAIIIQSDVGKEFKWQTFFADKLNDDQEQKIEKLNEKIRFVVDRLQKNLEKGGFLNLHILNLNPLKRMHETHEVVYTTSGRIICDMKGLLFPVYAQAYVLNRNGQGAVMLIFSDDADGAFWKKTGDRLMESLHHQAR